MGQGSAITQRSTMFLSAVSLLTTAAGITSMGPSFNENLSSAVVWVGVAVCFAAGVSLGIYALAQELYNRFTVKRLCGLTILTTVSLVFDAGFFQKSYARYLETTVSEPTNVTKRRNEYDRLVREHAEIFVSLRREVETRLLAATQGKEEAEIRVRYETKLRLPPSARYCGPRCEQYKRKAARYGAEIEQLEDMKQLLAQAPIAPASNEWGDLRTFHTESIQTLRRFPGNDRLSFPAAPNEPEVLTRGGNAQSDGGLGVVTEMLVARQFNQTKLLLPLVLSAFCEYSIIILVLTVRPWNSCRDWFRHRLKDIEETVDRTPALLPLSIHIVKHGLFTECKEARERRRKNNALLDDWEEACRTSERVRENDSEEFSRRASWREWVFPQFPVISS